MRQTVIVLFIIWLAIVALVSCVRADHNDVYSIYLERANYIHEVDSGLIEYNPNVDEALGIDLQNACEARGKSNPKHCWIMMLFKIGAEFSPYRGQF